MIICGISAKDVYLIEFKLGLLKCTTGIDVIILFHNISINVIEKKILDFLFLKFRKQFSINQLL